MMLTLWRLGLLSSLALYTGANSSECKIEGADVPCLETFSFQGKEYNGCLTVMEDGVESAPFCLTGLEDPPYGWCNEFCYMHQEDQEDQKDQADQKDQENPGANSPECKIEGADVTCLETFSYQDKEYNGCLTVMEGGVESAPFCLTGLEDPSWGWCNEFCNMHMEYQEDQENPDGGPSSSDLMYADDSSAECKLSGGNLDREGLECLSSFYINGQEYNGCTMASVGDWVPQDPFCLVQHDPVIWGFCNENCKKDQGSKRCAAGYRLEQGECVDIDECAEVNECWQQNVKCQNEPGGYKCVCVDDYTYSYDEQRGSCICRNMPDLEVCPYCAESEIKIVTRINNFPKVYCKSELTPCLVKREHFGYLSSFNPEQLNNIYQVGNGYNMLMSNSLQLGSKDQGHLARQIFSPFSYSPKQSCDLVGYTWPDIGKSCTANRKNTVFHNTEEIMNSITDLITKDETKETASVTVSESENAQHANSIAFGVQVSRSTQGSSSSGNNHCVDKNVAQSSSINSALAYNGQKSKSSSQSSTDSRGSSNTNARSSHHSSTKDSSHEVGASVTAGFNVGFASGSATASYGYKTGKSQTSGGSSDNSNTNTNERSSTTGSDASSSSGWSANVGRDNSNSNSISTNICGTSDKSSSSSKDNSDTKNSDTSETKGSSLDKSYTIPGYLDSLTSSKVMTVAGNSLKDSKTILSITMVKCKVWGMKMNTVKFPSFSEDFKARIQALHEISQKYKYRLKVKKTGEDAFTTNLDPKIEEELDNAFSDFISTFGTHYIDAAYFGGGTVSTYRMTETSNFKDSEASLKDCMEEVLHEHLSNTKGGSKRNSNKKCKDPEQKRQVKQYSQIEELSSYSEGGPLILDESRISDWTEMEFRNPVHTDFTLQPIITIFQEKMMNIDRISTKEGTQINAKEIFSWFHPRYAILMDRCTLFKNWRVNDVGSGCEICPVQHIPTPDRTKCVGEWASWSGWGQCTKTCGDGAQHRRRLCKARECPGNNAQERPCLDLPSCLSVCPQYCKYFNDGCYRESALSRSSARRIIQQGGPQKDNYACPKSNDDYYSSNTVTILN